MSMSERDTELLETYLDRETTSQESAEVEQRLATEPALASRLDELKSHRAMRLKAFNGGRVEDEMVEHLLAESRAVRASEAIRLSGWSRFRYASTAAACLLVGLAVGSSVRVERPAGSMNTAGLMLPAGGPPATTTVANAPRLPMQGIWVVNILNNDGQVMARFGFATEAEARQFAQQAKAWSDPTSRAGIREVIVGSESY
jgi:anti-sigma factor RsiW